ncbi:hypothetical protein HOLleu_16852 [Holothuria leucospilota]|uniref:Secreted protein n=1 Tax=Holothuria leucospilota TaxID=206669 RepID=A0A9Q1HAQ9_HOLLE|nr:hypothetical protein HOLleu_16852 [Holothuria leucospilota]
MCFSSISTLLLFSCISLPLDEESIRETSWNFPQTFSTFYNLQTYTHTHTHTHIYIYIYIYIYTVRRSTSPVKI